MEDTGLILGADPRSLMMTIRSKMAFESTVLYRILYLSRSKMTIEYELSTVLYCTLYVSSLQRINPNHQSQSVTSSLNGHYAHRILTVKEQTDSYCFSECAALAP